MEDSSIVIIMSCSIVYIVGYWEITRGNYNRVVDRLRTLMY